MLPNALKDSLIEQEEWFTIVGATVHAHGFALCAGANRDIGVTLSPKCPTLEVRLAVQVLMDLCPPLFGFGDGLWKLHRLKVEQDPPKSDGDLEGA